MADDTARARARQWLGKHRLGHIEPSELLVARLEARRRGYWVYTAASLAFITVMVVTDAIGGRNHSVLDPEESTVGGIAWFALMNVALILALCLGWWYQQRAERRLLPPTRTRSAHPAAAGVAKVLGRTHLVAVTVVHGGALLLGAAAALLAPEPDDRMLALAFLVAVAVLAALGCLGVAAVLRRPSVAEDSESLLVDDVLRTQEAQSVLSPFPILIALAACARVTPGSWMLWALLGYCAIGTVCWLLAELMLGLRAPRGLAAVK